MSPWNWVSIGLEVDLGTTFLDSFKGFLLARCFSWSEATLLLLLLFLSPILTTWSKMCCIGSFVTGSASIDELDDEEDDEEEHELA